MAKTLEELQVCQRARAAADAPFAIAQAVDLARRDRDLWGQLNRASVRVASDVAEGFEQKTDRHFASYLYNALGGAAEITTQIRIAGARQYVRDADEQSIFERYSEAARMLRALIAHLERENRANRRSPRTETSERKGEPDDSRSPNDS